MEIWFYTGNLDANGNKRTVCARSDYDFNDFNKKGWIEVKEKEEISISVQVDEIIPEETLDGMANDIVEAINEVKVTPKKKTPKKKKAKQDKKGDSK